MGDVCHIVDDGQDIPVVMNFQKRKREDDDECQHPEDPAAVMPADEDFPALIKIAVVGHSFVRRLREHLHAERGPSFNMGLDPGSVSVTFLSRGGVTVNGMNNGLLQAVKSLRPHLVYLELGSNDATRTYLSPNHIVNSMSSLARNLVQSGVQRVIFGQVLWREDAGIPASIPTYNWKVVMLNRVMARVLPNLPGTSYWKHRGLWNSLYPILMDDGIHLTDVGNHKLYRSIRGALIQAVPFIQP